MIYVIHKEGFRMAHCLRSEVCNFIKKEPLNFVKFLRTPFLTEHLRWLLLTIKRRSNREKQWARDLH